MRLEGGGCSNILKINYNELTKTVYIVSEWKDMMFRYVEYTLKSRLRSSRDYLCHWRGLESGEGQSHLDDLGKKGNEHVGGCYGPRLLVSEEGFKNIQKK